MGYNATKTTLTNLTPNLKNVPRAYQQANLGLRADNFRPINQAVVRDAESDGGILGQGTKGYILYLHGNPLWAGSNAEHDLIYTVLLQINWRSGEVAAKELPYDGGAPRSFIKALPQKLAVPAGHQEWAHLNELIDREKQQAKNTRNLPRLIRPGAKVRFASPLALDNGEVVEWFDVVAHPSPTGRAMTSLAHKGVAVSLKRGWRGRVRAVIPAGDNNPVTARRDEAGQGAAVAAA